MKALGADTSSTQVVRTGSINIEDIREGDNVIVARLSVNEVEVVQKLSKKELTLAIGAMRAKVKVEEIVSVNQRKVSHASSASKRTRGNGTGKKQLRVRTAANDIDIRGQRVDSAEPLVDRAISKALDIGTLWVIHGHGTGRLRDGIRGFYALQGTGNEACYIPHLKVMIMDLLRRSMLLSSPSDLNQLCSGRY